MTACRGCGTTLNPQNHHVADGCPCNSRRGINHGLVPTYVCTCASCDPSMSGSARSPPGITNEARDRLNDAMQKAGHAAWWTVEELAEVGLSLDDFEGQPQASLRRLPSGLYVPVYLVGYEMFLRAYEAAQRLGHDQ